MSELLDGIEEIRKLQRIMNNRRMLKRRNEAMIAARNAGWTLQEIAIAVGISRERVRQIIQNDHD